MKQIDEINKIIKEELENARNVLIEKIEELNDKYCGSCNINKRGKCPVCDCLDELKRFV